ncbi:MAG TPA: glycosyltransferase family 1 protein [Anaerolineae bacterium]|nr:glycosyltransferase family 1 protein [Anaerolineae bacterium]
MYLAFLNPQGNFDPQDRYWTEHPDFGGQLVYVKELALALADQGHYVDILTRRVRDPDWPGFESSRDAYPGYDRVRIVRIPCGGDRFLPKEKLWPYLGTKWVSGILSFYRAEGRFPDALTAHYADGGLSAALIGQRTGRPFTFTAHSLGAQKMDKLGARSQNLALLDAQFRFARRIFAERVSMSHAAVIVVSTEQERIEQYAHPAYRGAVDVNDATRFTVIPPGVNLRIFGYDVRRPQEDMVAARIEAMFRRDLAPDRRDLPAIISASRLDSKKNHLGLVQAFASSPPLQTQANLVFITRGLDDPLRDLSSATNQEHRILEQIVCLVEEYNLWGKVSAFSLAGQGELAAAYRYLAQRRSVFALTSHYEPFGLAPLEAMATGLPAVVTRNGGPAESLQEGSRTFGVLVDPADPADIARGLLTLLASPETWAHYRQAGLQRVHDRYTWERTAERYARLLERILQIGREDIVRPEPIPPYFTHPTPETDISLQALEHLYFWR